MSSDLCDKIVAFLEELIDVQNHLESMPRSWVPMDHDLKTVIFSQDGSIEGYSGRAMLAHNPFWTNHFVQELQVPAVN